VQTKTLGLMQTDVAAVLACLSWPIACLQLAGWLVYLHVPATIGCDLIYQSTRKVESMSHSTCNWNQVMSEVQSCHETALCLSALLAPVMLANMTISWLFVALWAVCSSVSRDNLLPDSWVAVYVPDWLLFLAILTMFVNAVAPLFVGASTTSACDGLVDALNNLRTSSDQGRKVQMCNPANLMRMNGILQYASELNTSQGIGFTLRRKRISSNFVLRVLIKGTALVMATFVFFVFNKQRRSNDAAGPAGADINTDGLDNATATADTGSRYFEPFAWVMMMMMVVALLLAFGAVMQCRRVQRQGTPWYDRADLREVETHSTFNMLGLENRGSTPSADGEN
jgi:hypothetical protein